VRVSLELVSSGKRLGAADFFTDGSGWESFISKRAYADYLASLKERGESATRTEADYLAGVTDIDHWRTDEKTFTYEFAPADIEDFGSSTSFSWKELRPYLRDDLPFRPDFD
jgi:hypothetical protein